MSRRRSSRPGVLPRRRARTGGRLVRSFGLLCIGAALVAGGVSAWAYWTFTRPGPLDGPTTVVVPRGAGLGDVAALLGEAGVLGQPEVFAAAARLTGKGRSIRAGEYAFAPRVSGARVLDKIGRASCRKECVSTCRSRWSPYQ